MIPELGHFSLILSLFVALVLGLLSLIGAHQGRRDWVVLARPATQALWLLTALAYGCLTYAFYSNDFSVVYVVQHSNSQLPDIYRIAGVWGGHEGSLLLWHFMLTSWMLAVSLFSRQLPDAMVARVLGVLGLVAVGFLVFMLFTSNPFLRLADAPADGRDLNPLLQDPGLVFHPPMLYMGYVGLAIPFAFAIAALLNGRLDAAWARWSRPWATAAWIFLTLGIALGSWWAYYELGWGGWWFWDPVENASFLPWLVSAALIHSLAVTEKRGLFRNWTIVLAITAFSLSLLGTFLVRSGVLTSVHAFATDPSRGIYILGFLIIVIGGSLILFAWRAPLVGGGSRFDLLSREAMLLANNLLLLVACAAVLLGTLYPLLLDALGLGKLSVGPPYFDSVLVPLMAPALFLMGVGPLARWGGDQVPDLARLLRWALAVSLASALLAPWLMGGWSALVGLGLFFAFWIFATTVLSLIRQWRPMGRDGLWLRVRKQPRSYYGMLLAHCGLAVFIVGVTLVKGYEQERDVTMEPGLSTTLAGYEFRFDGVRRQQGPNYLADVATLQVLRGDRVVATLQPERRLYTAGRNPSPMTEAAIHSGLARDLYAALGESLGGNRWVVRVYYKPFIAWIWWGCGFMALGGFWAVLDRRYRPRALAAAQPAPPGAVVRAERGRGTVALKEARR